MTRNRVFRFYCQICNWKSIVRKPEEAHLTEMTLSPIPKGNPTKVDKEFKPPEPHKPARKFKCPQCGRVVMPVQIPDTQAILEDKIKEDKRKKDLEADAAELKRQAEEKNGKKEQQDIKQDAKEDIRREIADAVKDSPPPLPLLDISPEPLETQWQKKSTFSM